MVKSKSAYSVPSKLGKLDTHIIVVWVDNEASVLSRVVGLFSGRGYNIESLAVAEVDAKKRREGKDTVLDKTNVVLEGIASGMEDGIALPFTLAGRLANQKTPWADPPATLKDSPLGETVFEIAQVVTPTLLFGGVGGVDSTCSCFCCEHELVLLRYTSCHHVL